MDVVVGDNNSFTCITHLHKLFRTERYPIMATSYSSMTASTPRYPMNHIIPFPPVPPRKLNLVPNKVSAAPMLAPTSEGQTTMSNFLAGKSRREYLADES